MSDKAKSVEADVFKSALSRFASGVTVVTTVADGARFGITVSAFSSLSLEPPLVLICIAGGAPSHDAIANAGKFVVNILSADQEAISNMFASRVEDKFEGIEWHAGDLGLPVIDGSLGSIECVLHDSLAGGDHTIYVGRVVGAHLTDGQPLIYGEGGYRRLSESERS